MSRTPLLELVGIHKSFPGAGRPVAAVDGVSLHVDPGEILGIVGESGSGKTTLARITARLIESDQGRILFDGQDITAETGRRFGRNPLRRAMQMVFQDPLASLNPRFRAGRAIADPVRRLGNPDERAAEARLVAAAADAAGLPERLLASYPHQLSGGERARVGIARAIVLKPRLVILDEPTSALDAPLRAHVARRLLDLRRELGCAFVFVSHNLDLVRLIADRVLVMRHGTVIESGSARAVFAAPQEDYTRRLLAAIPRLDRASPAPRPDATS